MTKPFSVFSVTESYDCTLATVLDTGQSASDLIGDTQGVSNIDDDEYTKLYEIFIGTNLFSLFDIENRDDGCD